MFDKMKFNSQHGQQHRKYTISIKDNLYIFIHHQDGSTVDIRRLNKIYNLTKKQRMKQSNPNAHAMR